MCSRAAGSSSARCCGSRAAGAWTATAADLLGQLPGGGAPDTLLGQGLLDDLRRELPTPGRGPGPRGARDRIELTSPYGLASLDAITPP